MQSEGIHTTYTLIYKVYILAKFLENVSERLHCELDEINIYLLFTYYDYKIPFY